jgi:hypothetical protein
MLDVVDFNKSCEEVRGTYFDLSGIPVYYFFCPNCQFCFAPEFGKWSVRDFEEKIYNGDYALVDKDYIEVRPRGNANLLLMLFKNMSGSVRHLDYGGGNGLLSRLLNDAKWQSRSYDPFVDREVDVGTLGQYDLVTAFEVFEHVPDVRKLARDLSSLLADNGLVVFSTSLSDGHIAPLGRLTWWYASPRNGHISLFSKKSLSLLGASEGFNVGSFSEGLHAFWRKLPPWAEPLFNPALGRNV